MSLRQRFSISQQVRGRSASVWRVCPESRRGGGSIPYRILGVGAVAAPSGGAIMESNRMKCEPTASCFRRMSILRKQEMVG